MLLYTLSVVFLVFIFSWFLIFILLDNLTSFFIRIGFFNDGVFVELNTIAFFISLSIFLIGVFNFVMFCKKKIDNILFFFSESILLILLINFVTAFVLMLYNVPKPKWVLWF
jgi:hypothetical protein